MQRSVWGIVYSLIGVAILGSVALLGCSIALNSEPLGLTGVALCVLAIAAFRFANDIGWLKTERASLHDRHAAVQQEELRVHARAAILENQTQQALREMDEVERRRTEALETERAALHAQIEAEREALLCDIEAKRSAIREDGVRIGHMLGVRGITFDAVESHTNVITLPVGEARATTMGEGRIHNR
ncbi:hypothetical protein [Streptacidiphilus sp. EB129]|uniref:hypothetical protein n=1 Tax=Streptacidiphilus sp. EB129 TaxID=3156262 RepID=UPI00351129F8